MNINNMNFHQMMWNMNFNRNIPWNPIWLILNQNAMYNQQQNNMVSGGNSKNKKEVNLVFKHKNTNKITFLESRYDESFGSAVNTYINQSSDCNVNKYLLNGKKINESLSISMAGIKNYDIIEVVPLSEEELNNL